MMCVYELSFGIKKKKKITLQLFQALSTCRVRATSKALHLSFNYSTSLPVRQVTVRSKVKEYTFSLSIPHPLLIFQVVLVNYLLNHGIIEHIYI